MTKRGAAISVICTYNWCSNNCPMFLSSDFKCLANETADAELIKIARKEYARKSKKKEGADYMRVVSEEWAVICKGVTVV